MYHIYTATTVVQRIVFLMLTKTNCHEIRGNADMANQNSIEFKIFLYFVVPLRYDYSLLFILQVIYVFAMTICCYTFLARIIFLLLLLASFNCFSVENWRLNFINASFMWIPSCLLKQETFHCSNIYIKKLNWFQTTEADCLSY